MHESFQKMHRDRLNPSFLWSTYLETSFEIWFSKSDSESNKSSSDSDDAIISKTSLIHENHEIDREKQSWNVTKIYSIKI